MSVCPSAWMDGRTDRHGRLDGLSRNTIFEYSSWALSLILLYSFLLFPWLFLSSFSYSFLLFLLLCFTLSLSELFLLLSFTLFYSFSYSVLLFLTLSLSELFLLLSFTLFYSFSFSSWTISLILSYSSLFFLFLTLSLTLSELPAVSEIIIRHFCHVCPSCGKWMKLLCIKQTRFRKSKKAVKGGMGRGGRRIVWKIHDT